MIAHGALVTHGSFELSLRSIGISHRVWNVTKRLEVDQEEVRIRIPKHAQRWGSLVVRSILWHSSSKDFFVNINKIYLFSIFTELIGRITKCMS